jgi:hypothetical protein
MNEMDLSMPPTREISSPLVLPIMLASGRIIPLNAEPRACCAVHFPDKANRANSALVREALPYGDHPAMLRKAASTKYFTQNLPE